MDERIRVRTFDRRAARPANPPRPYPGDERRVLSPEALQGPATAPARSRAGRPRRPRYRRNPRSLITTEPAMRYGPLKGSVAHQSAASEVADFYSAAVAGFCSAVDMCRSHGIIFRNIGASAFEAVERDLAPNYLHTGL